MFCFLLSNVFSLFHFLPVYDSCVLSNTIIFKGSVTLSAFSASCFFFHLTSAELIELLWKELSLLSIPLEAEQQNGGSCTERCPPAAGEVWQNGCVQNPISLKWVRNRAEKKQSNSFVIAQKQWVVCQIEQWTGKEEYWLEVSSVNYQNWKWDEQPKCGKGEATVSHTPAFLNPISFGSRNALFSVQYMSTSRSRRLIWWLKLNLGAMIFTQLTWE